MSDKDTHTYLEVNGDFRMRELDHNDLEQFNALLQYAFQVTSYELFQTGWEQEEIKYAKRPILEDAYVLGWFYKEKLASMIVVYSMQINIQDNIMAMGGITGVTTYPEYTGRGLIHSLMRYIIDYMHKKKLPISFLYPYSIPFYRKMGWEIVSDKLTFTVKDTQLPKAFPVRAWSNVSAWIPRIFITCIPISPCSTTVHSFATSWPGMNTGAGKMMIDRSPLL